jgi:hypothetical protein
VQAYPERTWECSATPLDHERGSQTLPRCGDGRGRSDGDEGLAGCNEHGLLHFSKRLRVVAGSSSRAGIAGLAGQAAVCLAQGRPPLPRPWWISCSIYSNAKVREPERSIHGPIDSAHGVLVQ